MIKINKLEIENVKRVKAIRLEPCESGLTVVGGRNGQGKTSVLDAIAWALGGERYRPSQPWREGSVIPPNLHIVLSNGLIVERNGKNSALKVTDPDGRKGGQQLLNEFVEQLALDLPRFMQASGADKAKILLRIIGIEDKLAEMDRAEKELYNKRLAIGQIADQKAKYAKEMKYHLNVPKAPVSAGELIRKQQEILARNGENQRKRDRLNEITRCKHNLFDEMRRIDDTIASLEKQKSQLIQDYNHAVSDEQTAMKTVMELQDESTAELEKSIEQIDQINAMVRTNLEKDRAEEEAQMYRNQYSTLTSELNKVRQDKIDLLKEADLPLPELTVCEGELLYKGHKWDNMSGSEQLKVATAIVHKLNPKCGFVLLDKLEQMDSETLKEFGQWLEDEGLQVIATRVSTGDECSIIIEDGCVIQSEIKPAMAGIKWKAGEF